MSRTFERVLLNHETPNYNITAFRLFNDFNTSLQQLIQGFNSDSQKKIYKSNIIRRNLKDGHTASNKIDIPMNDGIFKEFHDYVFPIRKSYLWQFSNAKHPSNSTDADNLFHPQKPPHSFDTLNHFKDHAFNTSNINGRRKIKERSMKSEGMYHPKKQANILEEKSIPSIQPKTEKEELISEEKFSVFHTTSPTQRENAVNPFETNLVCKLFFLIISKVIMPRNMYWKIK